MLMLLKDRAGRYGYAKTGRIVILVLLLLAVFVAAPPAVSIETQEQPLVEPQFAQR